jgi:hypothetical protein
MYYELLLPTNDFNVAENDEYRSKIIIQNSYDCGKSFSIQFAIERCICSNGAIIFVKEYGAKIIHLNQNINLDKIGINLKLSIDKIQSTMKENYKKLTNTNGLIPLNTIMKENKIPIKYKNEAIEELNSKGIQLNIIKEEDKIKEIKSIEKFNAYLLWNIFTAIITHKIKKDRTKRILNLRIAKYFLR